MDLDRVIEVGSKLIELRIGILQRNLALASAITSATQQNMQDRLDVIESLTSPSTTTTNGTTGTNATTGTSGTSGTTGASSTKENKFLELLLERMAQSAEPNLANRTNLVAILEKQQADEALKRAR